LLKAYGLLINFRKALSRLNITKEIGKTIVEMAKVLINLGMVQSIRGLGLMGKNMVKESIILATEIFIKDSFDMELNTVKDSTNMLQVMSIMDSSKIT
jgi:hypothetical protein